MAERKLATVEEILALEPIENADALELATVRGWGVVVRKGEFSVGQRVVYFEIDSFLDVERPEFSFLASRGTRVINDPEDEKKKLYGHALRTIKLRGQISQGLVLPIEDFGWTLYDVPLGADVTDELGVLKYEPYVKPQSGPRKLYTFPTRYAVKSDAERVQNLSQRQWDALQTILGWYATVKIDGQSVTYWRDEEGSMHVATRNFEVVDDNPEFPPMKWMSENLVTLQSELSQGDAIQGELYGEGIQGNKLGIKGIHFAPFTYFRNAQVIPRKDHWELGALGDIAVPKLDLPFPKTIKEAVAQANDLRYANGSQAEGIVWHNSDPEVAKILGRNCFKSLNQKFLLKHEK